MNIQQIAPQIQKTELSIDGVSEVVDFQQMMLSMLGLLVPTKGNVEETSMQGIQNETSMQTSGIQTTLSIVDEIQPGIPNQLSDESFLKMAQEIASMPAKTIEILTSALKDMTDETASVDKQIMDMEKALGVERMDVEVSQNQVQHTMQSLQNIMRIKFAQDKIPNSEINSSEIDDAIIPQQAITPKLEESPDLIAEQSVSKPMKVENIDQIKEVMISAIKETTSEGSSRIKVNLKPVELGSMEVELKMEKGMVEAVVRVKDETVKAQITEVFSNLKDQLSKEGFQIRNFEVTTQFGQGQQQQQTMQQHRQDGGNRQFRQETVVLDE